METYSRRTAVKLSAQAFMALSAAMPLFGCANKQQEEKAQLISWNDFIKKIQNLSDVQTKKNWNQQSYVKDVEKVMKSLDLSDKFIKTFEKRYKNAHKNFPEINAMHKEQKFMVSLLEFEAGERIQLHDHPDMTGVIYCTQGRVNIQNYNLMAGKSSNNKLLLKQTANITMTPGQSGFLTAKSGNIHALQADKFTRLIDVFTPPYNKDRIKRSKWYSKDSKYYNGTSGLFEAKTL